MGNVRYHKVIAATLAICAQGIAAAPTLTDPASGTLTLVASGTQLARVDGLTFDAHGNLIAALEIVGPGGGVVYVNKTTGSVGSLLAAVSGADQVKLHPSGSLYVTSELNPPPGGVGGIYRVDVAYSGTIPVGATALYLSTAGALINNPEGLVALKNGGAFGAAGDLVVAEDRTGGRVIQVAFGSSGASATPLIDSNAGLQRPEGLAFGDFNGTAQSALYLAETAANRVLRIEATGAYAEFGNSAAIGLQLPDNLAFGPDGWLYVSEDLTGANSGRILRLGADGSYRAFAEGFKKPAGMAFDPATGDLYIAEQDANTIWRVQFATAVPEPRTYAMLLAGLGCLGFAAHHKRRARRSDR